MLTIRNSQLQILAHRPLEQFINDMQGHLYSYFPSVAWLLTPDERRQQVNTLIERAAVYQLTSQQQVCRFINLAATYGWEFDRDPNLHWMRSILTDISLAQPTERLDRLVQTCLHRQSIEEHNQALRQQLGLVAVITPSTPEPEPAEDYASHNHYGKTEPVETSPQEIITRNPLSYQLSQSLWHSQEDVLVMSPIPAAPVWVTDTPALLRRKTGGRHVLGN